MADEQEQSIEQWRRKYYDSLGELEEKEKQWLETESVLRLLVSRLTLIAETEDDKLNTQLDNLRQSIREEQSSHTLKRSIETISSNINNLKTDNSKSRLDPVAPLKSLLNKIDVPMKLKKQERLLRKQLDVADSSDIDQAVQNMVDLIGYINQYSAAGNATSDSSPPIPAEVPLKSADQKKTKDHDVKDTKSGGFLSGLFGKKGQPEEQPQPVAPQQRPIVKDIPAARIELEVKSEKTEHAVKEEKPTTSVKEAEQTIEQVRTDGEVDIKAARETLIDLIEHFDLPGDLAFQANQIKSRLESCETRDELISLVEGLADLVSEVHKRVEKERGDLEDFLKQLTGRLQEIDTDIRESAKIHDDAYKNSQSINTTVKSEVKGIESSVSEALDLDALKRVIQSRVVILRDHMDKFIDAEEKRHEQSNKLIGRLQDRVDNMESETKTLKEEVRKKQEEATKDALTGIANRLAYNERLENEIARNKRYQKPLTILVWDIDKFKSINDTYGHAAGDKVLKAIAKVLDSNIRETDFIARFGGEEFVVLMPETTLDAAEPVANKLRETIEACEFHFKDKRVVITASCGLAEIKHNETAEQFFERADKALYQAKESGRNKCIMAK